MGPQYSTAVKLVLAVAAGEAIRTRCKNLRSEHLFLALCRICDMDDNTFQQHCDALEVDAAGCRKEFVTITEDLIEAHIDFVETSRRLRNNIDKQTSILGEFDGHRSDECRAICREAEQRAAVLGESEVALAYIIRALLSNATPLLRAAIGENTPAYDYLCKRYAAEPVGVAVPAGVNPGLDEAGAVAEDPRPNQSPTPLLDKFGRDLTALAREDALAPCVGRRHEMRTVAQTLRRQTKNNPVLVGDAGVGKTCIVEGIAQRVVHADAPEAIRNWRIIEISMASLIAGCAYQGQFEQRMKSLIEEAQSDPNIVLFLDELHTLVGAGGSSDKGMDAAQILKPALARGALRLIGATTTAEYRKYIESDAALERRFQLVWVDEPTREEAVEILMGVRQRLEKHHSVVIDENAIEKAVDWSMQYIHDHRLPDKAIDLIDQAAATKAIQTLSPPSPGEDGTLDLLGAGNARITVDDVARVISNRCRVPVGALTADDQQRYLNMEASLAHRVIGQKQAIKDVAEAIQTAGTGLKKPNRPMGVFLFVGATGTGKTELAKALAEYLFGNEEALIRIDMSEYGEKHNMARLIGAPPGYVGHDEEGQLTGPVRTRPYSVVLFDEIEKAHPEVLDIFLQIFDDGRLTDGKGRRTVFTNAVLIMTSNLGAGAATAPRRGIGFAHRDQNPEERNGFDPASYRTQLESAVKERFRPEFVNRINRTVVFYPLTRDETIQILDKIIQQYNRWLAEKSVSLQLGEDAREYIINNGYNETYGARELERTFEKLVATPLAQEMLQGLVQPETLITVVVREGNLAFEYPGC